MKLKKNHIEILEAFKDREWNTCLKHKTRTGYWKGMPKLIKLKLIEVKKDMGSRWHVPDSKKFFTVRLTKAGFNIIKNTNVIMGDF